MKSKIIKLTENDIKRIVAKTIKATNLNEEVVSAGYSGDETATDTMKSYIGSNKERPTTDVLFSILRAIAFELHYSGASKEEAQSVINDVYDDFDRDVSDYH